MNVAMQCSIGFIYEEDGYVSIYEYEGTKKTTGKFGQPKWMKTKLKSMD